MEFPELEVVKKWRGDTREIRTARTYRLLTCLFGKEPRAYLTFLSTAKPSDLGTLGVVLVLVVFLRGGGGDHFWNLPMRSFSEVCSKVTRFFNIISKPK